QFARPPPPFSRVIQSVVQREQSHFLREEIVSLLRKEAIVPPEEEASGFYSHYFLVPKKDGNYRPILDLRVLNKALMPLRFRMLTPRRLVQFIKPNDWFITIDLKDASVQDGHLVVAHLYRLGFVINREKSVLCPSQITHFPGMILDSTSMEVRL